MFCIFLFRFDSFMNYGVDFFIYIYNGVFICVLFCV